MIRIWCKSTAASSEHSLRHSKHQGLLAYLGLGDCRGHICDIVTLYKAWQSLWALSTTEVGAWEALSQLRQARPRIWRMHLALFPLKRMPLWLPSCCVICWMWALICSDALAVPPVCSSLHTILLLMEQEIVSPSFPCPFTHLTIIVTSCLMCYYDLWPCLIPLFSPLYLASQSIWCLFPSSLSVFSPGSPFISPALYFLVV